jgi:hypothetical protein
MANRLNLSQAGAGVLALLGVMATMPSALAQTTSTDPAQTPVVNTNEGFGTTDSSSGVFGESGSPFDLIHRAVLMNEMSLSDFSRQHQNRMSNEAANFRVLQQEAIRRQAALEAAGEESSTN